jgi:hypothetical protein
MALEYLLYNSENPFWRKLFGERIYSRYNKIFFLSCTFLSKLLGLISYNN